MWYRGGNWPLQQDLVVFDGICRFCDASVHFIIRHDAGARFVFLARQSRVAERLLSGHQVAADSLVLVDADGVHDLSTAALRIAARLDGHWRWAGLLLVVPAPLRDGAYRWFAAHRYRWFGRLAACGLPTPALRRRFLG